MGSTLRMKTVAALVCMIALVGCFTSLAMAGDDVAAIFEKNAVTLVNVSYKIDSDRGIASSNGTGVFVNAEGLIMMVDAYFSEGVAADAFRGFSVKSIDKEEKTWEAKYLGRAIGTGFAFVQATLEEGETVAFVDFHSTYTPRVGEQVISIGLLGSNGSNQAFVTVGRVASKGEQSNLAYYLAYDTTRDPGTPVFSMDGNIIGVQGDSNNLGRIEVPEKFLKAIDTPPNPKARKKASWVGVTDLQPLTRGLSERWKVGQKDGIIVGNVIKGHPADMAGFKQGDVIVSLNGSRLVAGMQGIMQTLQSALSRYQPGDELTVGVWRSGETLALKLVLGERPTNVAHAEKWKIEAGSFNVTMREIVFMDRFNRYMSEDDTGVIVHYMEGGWAFDGGLRPGDVVQKVNNVEVKNLNEFRQIMEQQIQERKKEIVMQVVRGSLNQTYVARIESDWK